MPSFEIAGQCITVPDPDVVDTLAQRYRAVCGNITDSRSRLLRIGAASGAGEWTGMAADAFAGLLGQLPSQLDQAAQSFKVVTDALTSYSGGLNAVVARLSDLSLRAEQAESELAASRSARDQAVTQGHDAGIWDVRVQDAQAAVGDLVASAASLEQEVRALAADCTALIEQAQGESIQRDLGSFFGSILHDLVEPLIVAVDIENFAADVLYDAFVKPLVDIPGDCIQLAEHPSFHTLGIALGDVGSSLGLAAIAAAALIPGADAAAVPALAAYLRDAVLPVNVASAASNTAAVLLHQQSANWGDVAHSMLSIGLGRVAKQLGDGSRLMFLATGAGSKIASATVWDGAQHLFGWHSAMPAALQTPTDAAALVAPPHAALGPGASPGAAGQLPGGAALRFIGGGLTYSPAVWAVQHVQFTQ